VSLRVIPIIFQARGFILLINGRATALGVRQLLGGQISDTVADCPMNMSSALSLSYPELLNRRDQWPSLMTRSNSLVEWLSIRVAPVRKVRFSMLDIPVASPLPSTSATSTMTTNSPMHRRMETIHAHRLSRSIIKSLDRIISYDDAFCACDDTISISIPT